MDEKSITDLITDLIPDTSEQSRGITSSSEDDQNSILIGVLRMLVDQSGEPMQRTLEDFLGGKGELLEVTRAASGGRKKSAEAEIVDVFNESNEYITHDRQNYRADTPEACPIDPHSVGNAKRNQ